MPKMPNDIYVRCKKCGFNTACPPNMDTAMPHLIKCCICNKVIIIPKEKV